MKVVTMTATTTYTMTCTNEGGSGNALFPVPVAPPPAPTNVIVTQPDYCKTTGLAATIGWQAVTGASRYHVQVATDRTYTRGSTLIYDSETPDYILSHVHWWWTVLRWLGIVDEANAVINGSATIPAGRLRYGTAYFVRVRVAGQPPVQRNPPPDWSAWSADIQFDTPAGALPHPAFTASPVPVIAGIPVQFTDQSSPQPTVWKWDFGDGAQSILASPEHTYAASGSYLVTLSVSGATASGCSTQQMIGAQNPIPGYHEVVPGHPQQ
jgi:PKD repeat protein